MNQYKSLWRRAIMILPLAAMALTVAFAASSCGSDDDRIDEITLKPTEIPASDSLYYELDQINFLNTDCRYTVQLPVAAKVYVTFVFDCAQSVSWQLGNIPANVKVDRTSGNGWGYFTAEIAPNTSATQRTSTMLMHLIQHDIDGKEVISLDHQFRFIQPKSE